MTNFTETLTVLFFTIMVVIVMSVLSFFDFVTIGKILQTLTSGVLISIVVFLFELFSAIKKKLSLV